MIVTVINEIHDQRNIYFFLALKIAPLTVWKKNIIGIFFYFDKEVAANVWVQSN